MATERFPQVWPLWLAYGPDTTYPVIGWESNPHDGSIGAICPGAGVFWQRHEDPTYGFGATPEAAIADYEAKNRRPRLRSAV
jgi:hypothetical protein